VGVNGEVATAPALSPDGEVLYVAVAVHSHLHASGAWLAIQPLGTREHTVVAIATRDGAQKWVCPLGKTEVLSHLPSAAPLVCPAGGGLVYAGYEGGNVRAIEAATGKVKWEGEYGGRSVSILTAPAVSSDGSTVYVAGEHDLISGEARVGHNTNPCIT
jgi:outer membrane protein assembly factor BamB